MTFCIVVQVLKAVKTLKYILIHLMLPLLRALKLVLLKICFSNNQSSHIFFRKTSNSKSSMFCQ